MTRWIAAALAAAAVLAAPTAEAAKPKPVSGGWDATLPVPFAVEGEDGSHCATAPDGLSKQTNHVVLPYAGKFSLRLSGIVGDWVVEMYDAKGRRVAHAAVFDLASGERALSYKKKAAAKQSYAVVVCNVTGGPHGHVDWTFVPA